MILIKLQNSGYAHLASWKNLGGANRSVSFRTGRPAGLAVCTARSKPRGTFLLRPDIEFVCEPPARLANSSGEPPTGPTCEAMLSSLNSGNRTALLPLDRERRIHAARS